MCVVCEIGTRVPGIMRINVHNQRNVVLFYMWLLPHQHLPNINLSHVYLYTVWVKKKETQILFQISEKQK